MNEMMKLMTGRRTYRRFDQSRRIPEEVIGEIIESARLSSSARNDQQLTFAVVENAEKVEVIFPMTHFAGALPKELGTPKDGEHPVLYILLLNGCMVSRSRKLHHGRDRPEGDPGSARDSGKV